MNSTTGSERFTRTLAEALRRAGSDILGIELRELASTVRTRPFGYPLKSSCTTPLLAAQATAEC